MGTLPRSLGTVPARPPPPPLPRLPRAVAPGRASFATFRPSREDLAAPAGARAAGESGRPPLQVALLNSAVPAGWATWSARTAAAGAALEGVEGCAKVGAGGPHEPVRYAPCSRSSARGGGGAGGAGFSCFRGFPHPLLGWKSSVLPLPPSPYTYLLAPPRSSPFGFARASGLESPGLFPGKAALGRAPSEQAAPTGLPPGPSSCFSFFGSGCRA